jgi:hypothetical protein
MMIAVWAVNTPTHSVKSLTGWRESEKNNNHNVGFEWYDEDKKKNGYLGN